MFCISPVYARSHDNVSQSALSIGRKAALRSCSFGSTLENMRRTPALRPLLSEGGCLIKAPVRERLLLRERKRGTKRDMSRPRPERCATTAGGMAGEDRHEREVHLPALRRLPRLFIYVLEIAAQLIAWSHSLAACLSSGLHGSTRPWGRRRF